MRSDRDTELRPAQGAAPDGARASPRRAASLTDEDTSRPVDAAYGSRGGHAHTPVSGRRRLKCIGFSGGNARTSGTYSSRLSARFRPAMGP